MGALGTAIHAIPLHTASGQWALEHLQRTTSLPGGIGHWNSCNTLTHRLGAVGSRTPPIRCPNKWRDAESYPRADRCLKSGTPAMHSLSAWRHWAVELLPCPPHCLGALGIATPTIQCLTAPRWVLELLQRTASLPRGNVQCNLCNALPHRLGALGSGFPAMRGPTSRRDGKTCIGGSHCLNGGPPAMYCHNASGQWAAQFFHPKKRQCLTAQGQWVVELLQYTGSPPGGGGVGSGTPATHYFTAWG